MIRYQIESRKGKNYHLVLCIYETSPRKEDQVLIWKRTRMYDLFFQPTFPSQFDISYHAKKKISLNFDIPIKEAFDLFPGKLCLT